MRSIDVSTDVYAAIWAARQPGEDTEDAILSRVFHIPAAAPSIQVGASSKVTSFKIGFKDARFGIELPEGFEIFRNHKGTEYRAKAYTGKWKLTSDGREFPSLNQLSRATSGNTENAWRNWYFMGKDGKRYLVEGLRSDIPNNVRHLV